MANGRPGSAPHVEKREQFARLIAQVRKSGGVPCRIVGTYRRTGKVAAKGRFTADLGTESVTFPAGQTAVITPGSRQGYLAC
jgi:hypothetical protein